MSMFKDFYNSIINENVSIAKEVATKAKKHAKQVLKNIKKQEQKEISKKETENTDSGVKTLEKDFLNKFIRYNELQLLMRDLPEIANSFKTIQGFDEQLIADTVQKLLTDRQTEIDTLTKELTDLREQITKEAEVAQYKKSIIDLFDKQAVDAEPSDTNAYGYCVGGKCKDNGEAYNTGATLAGKDGIPTVSVGMPEVTDAEELPSDETQPGKIDDLQQAEQLSADALPGDENLPDEGENLPERAAIVLIDSKKGTKKTTKKTGKAAKTKKSKK